MLRELVRLHNSSPVTYEKVEKLEKKIKVLQETNRQLLNQIIASYEKPKKELTLVKWDLQLVLCFLNHNLFVNF